MKTVNYNSYPKKPCVGCVYFDACGNSNRTRPCKGRLTKSQLNTSNKENVAVK